MADHTPAPTTPWRTALAARIDRDKLVAYLERTGVASAGGTYMTALLRDQSGTLQTLECKENRNPADIVADIMGAAPAVGNCSVWRTDDQAVGLGVPVWLRAPSRAPMLAMRSLGGWTIQGGQPCGGFFRDGADDSRWLVGAEWCRVARPDEAPAIEPPSPAVGELFGPVTADERARYCEPTPEESAYETPHVFSDSSVNAMLAARRAAYLAALPLSREALGRLDYDTQTQNHDYYLAWDELTEESREAFRKGAEAVALALLAARQPVPEADSEAGDK